MTRPPIQWTTADSARLYRIPAWGGGYYRINGQGHLCVCPQGVKTRQIDLRLLMDELRERHIDPPVLIRFMDILSDRIKKLKRCFRKACQAYEYRGAYRPVYPIKVNQQRQVVEAMVQAGVRHGLGLEVGSKPELLAVLAVAPESNTLIICNGCKDMEFVETALRARHLGKNTIVVVEKAAELQHIVALAKRLGVRPEIGVRLKLSTRGEGRWADSAGDRSKFGLRLHELMDAVNCLRDNDMIDCLTLIHVHIGSQLSEIRRVRVMMAEVARFYAELHKLGVPIAYVDVGGGLGVDYEGAATRSAFSLDYTIQEYANDIILALQQVCDAQGLDHPAIITESGRALAAHYSVLVTNVVEVTTPPDTVRSPLPEEPSPQLRELWETHRDLDLANCRESYHDAAYLRDEVRNLFNLGYMSLEERAVCEELYWAIVARVNALSHQHRLNHPEFEGLARQMGSIYFANFSIFQSLPDAWAIDQPFPIIPLQRLDECPDVPATVADITCDSDGHIHQYVSNAERRDLLPLHRLDPQDDRPYYLGVFLIGAYQEILGDMHNLFGDTNAVHVVLNGNGEHRISRVIKGDTVHSVLSYLQYEPLQLIERMRSKLETRVQNRKASLRDAADFLKFFEDGMNGYTYMED